MKTDQVFEQKPAANPWKPGVYVRFPWLGIGSLLVSLLGLTASIIILVTSDGAVITDWRFQPTVYLSIASTITNIALHFALNKGLSTAWWVKTMRPDTSLGDLHRYWHFGDSLLAAVTSFRYFNIIALACILTAVAPINGPFLQRASTVIIASTTTNQSVNVSMAPRLNVTTGYFSGRAFQVSMFSQQFLPVVQSYSTGADSNVKQVGCSSSGQCSGKIRGAGFATNCSSYTVPFDLQPTYSIDQKNVSNDPAIMNGTFIFMSLFSWDAEDASKISLDVQYKDTTDCQGSLIIRNCTLTSATVIYSVMIDGNKSTIALDPSTTIFDDAVEWTESGRLEEGVAPIELGLTVLGGLSFALNNQYSSTAHMRFVGAYGYELLSVGSVSTQYLDVASANASFSGICTTRFRDPTQDLLQAARNLMFQTAVAVAAPTDVQQIEATQVATHAIFRSHWQFFALAVLFTMLPMAIITTMFHGYWQLGRSVSMSPIELAKAFNAPLLSGENSNLKKEDLVKQVGDYKVRYGVVGNGLMGGEEVGKQVADDSELEQEHANGQVARLEIAHSDAVSSPEEGAVFM